MVADIAGSKGLVALLRFDGGRWSLQPVMIGHGQGADGRLLSLQVGARQGQGGNLAHFKERAGKLLRKKS